MRLTNSIPRELVIRCTILVVLGVIYGQSFANESPPPPVNDLCTSPSLIEARGSIVLAGSTPEVPCFAGIKCTGQGDVWFLIPAAEGHPDSDDTQYYGVFRLEDSDPRYSRIWVFEGECESLTLVGQTTQDSRSAAVQFPADTQKQYRIAVSRTIESIELDPRTLSYEIEYSFRTLHSDEHLPYPANDLCEDAYALKERGFVLTAGARSEIVCTQFIEECTHSPDVWFTYTVPSYVREEEFYLRTVQLTPHMSQTGMYDGHAAGMADKEVEDNVFASMARIWVFEGSCDSIYDRPLLAHGVGKVKFTGESGKTYKVAISGADTLSAGMLGYKASSSKRLHKRADTKHPDY